MLKKLFSNIFLNEENQSEKNALEDWKKSSVENLSALKDIVHLQNLENNLKDYQKVDAKAAWDKVDARIKTEPKLFSIHYLTRIAAVAVIILGTMFVFRNNTYKTEAEPIVYETSVKSEVNLTDGSEINLDKGSKLIEQGTRKVSLEGRAYFDIVSDKSAPFTIQTYHGVITVLGTEFNVKTYPDFSRIYVTEGSVKHTFNGRENILEVGDILTIEGNKITKSRAYKIRFDAWKEKSVVFNDESLRVVMDNLAEMYDFELSWDATEVEDKCRINTSFSSETVDQIFKELSIVAGLKYIFKNNKLTIQSFKC